MVNQALVHADAWQDLLKRARAAASGDEQAAGGQDILVAALAEHMGAPIRATLTCTLGDIGVLIGLTIVDNRVLMVVDPIAATDDKLAASPDVQLIFAHTSDMWSTLASALPPIYCLRAPATHLRGAAPDVLHLTTEQRDTMFDREEANLQVFVEAWEDHSTLVHWGNWWSVVDDHLYGVTSVEGHLIVKAWQPGAVASIFQQTIAAAMDFVQDRVPDTDLAGMGIADEDLADLCASDLVGAGVGDCVRV
ncbi:MAG: hypothetical protein FWF25_00860 [Propionibacteriaceae bacterium]|nr:hypothetical protein [Propionibacteriaceae bacterium]